MAFSDLLRRFALAAGFLLLALVLRTIVVRLLQERKIRSLGGHAATRRTLDPLGLHFIFSSVGAAKSHTDYQFNRDHFEKYGNPSRKWTVEFRLFQTIRIINTADEDNIKAILATQFNDFGKGKNFNEDFHDFLGDSIFTTDGQRWQESRSLIRPQFIKDRVSDLNTFENHIQSLLPLLESNKPGQSVNVANLFFRFTLDAATDFLLGESVDSLHNPEDRFAAAFGEVQRVQSIMARAGPLKKWINRKTFDEGLKTMDAFVQPIIDRTLRLSPEELEKRTKTDEGYTFLHALAAYTRDRTMLRDQLTAVLLAGRDTTACTLSWMFYHLSKRPRIVEKLRREILDRIGQHKMPSYEDLKSMKYLQWTINETLRLYPIVPFNVRMALKDTTLPRGGGPDGQSPIGVPAGTPIGYAPLVMQRRPDIYPETSDKFPHYLDFAPERWEHWTPKAWTYIPFNGGPRICVGQQFALTEIAYTTTRILQTYSRVECRMEGVPKEQAEIVLQPKDGVHVVFCRDE